MRARGDEGDEVSHLLFAYDTLVFCEASQTQIFKLVAHMV